MIAFRLDDSGRVGTMSYLNHVDAAEAKRCLTSVREAMPRFQPGFVLLSDLTGLRSMDLECAPILGEIMEICSARGMSTVIRVIPDPAKDIGFGLISQFHLSRKIHIQTHESLAEAISSLLHEGLPGYGAVPAPAPFDREAEDAQAEAHFTIASRKDAETNEGGLAEDSPQPGGR